ncbi:hypothetical protein JTB14_038173 [Gonioctena quinquepunctata]|nr:hypothetical protein JTB14_038173 [Gonioctena quinquepunctata]
MSTHHMTNSQKKEVLLPTALVSSLRMWEASVRKGSTKLTPELKAISRFRQPENKLSDNREQHQQYFHESPELGFMEKVLSTEITHGQFYIPYQAAIQEGSTTTEVRADAERKFQ